MDWICHPGTDSSRLSTSKTSSTASPRSSSETLLSRRRGKTMRKSTIMEITGTTGNNGDDADDDNNECFSEEETAEARSGVGLATRIQVGSKPKSFS